MHSYLGLTPNLLAPKSYLPPVTRATLLHVLARPTALGPAEVRELEQLAQAFPYCQTAHLLLAKAAHDQGTMLAGQRLRRAATYAADRTLLRRLIEQVEPFNAEESLPQSEAEAPVIAIRTGIPAPPVSDVAAPVPTPEATEVIIVAIEAPSIPALALETIAHSPEQEPVAALLIPIAPAPVPLAAVLPLPVSTTETPIVTPARPEAPSQTEVIGQEISYQEPDLPMLVDHEGIRIPAVAEVPEIFPESVPEVEQELPAQAPAVRPPVEVGAARFEFGLAEAQLLNVPTYELPGLVDEWAAAATTLSLGKPKLPVPIIVIKAVPEVPTCTLAAFTGDHAVGYAFGESSRLGFSLQLLNLLTDTAENKESTQRLAVTAQPPAAPLPPTGAFFEPDPLLLNHWATHCPLPPVLPSSLDLVNNFLRRQPRLTRPAMLPPSPATQADLSVRSTRTEPDLVSESLARILVRQGKTARAIEIYEKLMVRQPEKMAYFAAQIQSLQPPA